VVILTNSWKIWLAGLAVSLGIFAIIYFTVIKESNDRADEALQQSNQAIEQGLQQSQQALDQSQQQLDQSAGGAGGGGGGNANEQIKEAQQLGDCIAAAGNDAAALQECQAQFAP
jgi:hypothetical protein